VSSGEVREKDVSREEEHAARKNNREKILKALEKSSNVFAIEELGDTGFPSMSMRHRGMELTHGRPFHLKVSLPSRMQKYGNLCLRPSEAAEEFSVVSTGSLFAAYAPIETFPALSFIAHEYRELLRAQIEAETNLECPLFGPSPIHPDFYLVLRKPAEEARKADSCVYGYKGNVLVVLDGIDRPDSEIATEIFLSVALPMLRLYMALNSRTFLIKKYEEILGVFSQLSSETADLFNTRWWEILHSRKHFQAARQQLTAVHQKLVEIESMTDSHERARQRVLQAMSENLYLQHISRYCDQHMNPDSDVPSRLLSALEYYQGTLQSYGNIRSVMIASLVGAGVGALLGAALHQLFSG